MSCRLFLGSAKREERCRIQCTNNVAPRVSSIGTAVEEGLDVEAVAVSGCSEPRCNCRFHRQPSWGGGIPRTMSVLRGFERRSRLLVGGSCLEMFEATVDLPLPASRMSLISDSLIESSARKRASGYVGGSVRSTASNLNVLQ